MTDKVPFFIQTEIRTSRFRRLGDFTCLIIYTSNKISTYILYIEGYYVSQPHYYTDILPK